MTLTEFLLARISEDEASAREALRIWGPVSDGWPALTCHGEGDGLMVDPARVLAECAAKRAIVERYACADAPECGDHDCMTIHETRLILADVYADHPDYRSEWAPDE